MTEGFPGMIGGVSPMTEGFPGMIPGTLGMVGGSRFFIKTALKWQKLAVSGVPAARLYKKSHLADSIGE